MVLLRRAPSSSIVIPSSAVVVVVVVVWNLMIGMGQCKYMAYDTTSRTVPGKINIHLVPHTHNDVGWLKTVDQYYVGSNNTIQVSLLELDAIMY